MNIHYHNKFQLSHKYPRCHNSKIIKSGFARGQQRFKYKHCNYQFTTDKIDQP